MTRPSRFEEYRFLGDKRTQLVYDLDDLDETARSQVDEVLAVASFIVFSPDTLAEARNRGYRLASS